MKLVPILSIAILGISSFIFCPAEKPQKDPNFEIKKKRAEQPIKEVIKIAKPITK